MRIASLFLAALLTTPATAAPGTPVVETCPSAGEIGTNVECYPVTFTAKTEIHPDGIPIIAYLFVPTDRPPGEPLPAIVFAHGSGSMYSDGNHNKGLNSKHKQWVRQYTGELGIVGLHVDSFHSRYLLPDTEGDQRILEIDVPPDGLVGGDDYRATSYLGYREDSDGNPLPYEYLAFDPDPADDSDKWKDSGNGGAGVSEVMERAYDMDAAWDFLAGIRKGRYIESSHNDNAEEPTLGTPMAGVGYIDEIVNNGLVVDHERIFLYGTSHGGQAAMATAHAERALGDANPMNADLPAQFDRHRFAAFFDYYGGCGLAGAYGGSSNSTWRPYAPFLMLHGDHDDEAVFDEDEVPIDSLEGFRLTACGRRIAAAKNDNGFAQFLEAIVYKDAYHSFDGLERGDVNGEEDPDFGSWLAKIHANYRVTLPFMQAIGRIVSADRNDAALIPSLADFAFTAENLQFTTIPFDPWVPPTVFNDDNRSESWVIHIDDLSNTDVDLHDLIHDPLEEYPLTCEAIASPTAELEGCILKFRTEGANNGHHLYVVRTEKGQVIIGAYLRTGPGGRTADLEFFKQPIKLPPPGHRFLTPGENTFRFDARSVAAVPDWYWLASNNYTLRIGTPPSGTTYPPENGFVGGTAPVAEEFETLAVERGIEAIFTDYAIVAADDGMLEIRCCDYVGYSGTHGGSATPVLPPVDFTERYSGLDPVSTIAPPPPGRFPGSNDGDPGSDPDNGDPGDSEPRDGNSDDITGVDPETPRSGSGGGALFWLIPPAMLFRRRK